MKWRGRGGTREGWKKEEEHKRYASYGWETTCLAVVFVYTVIEENHSLDMTVNKRAETTHDIPWLQGMGMGTGQGTLPETLWPELHFKGHSCEAFATDIELTSD
jgi:hypothetical protein